MRYPSFIKEKDKIGFVSPAFGCATEPYKSAFENALTKFEDLGFKVNVGPNCYKSDGIGISTNPKDCGKEFMDYYLDGSNKALISCGGGELMCETLDYIDFDKLKNSEPKWFMGYSDNTNMTFLLTTLCDVASVYGPCAATFGMKPWHQALYDAMDVLEGNKNILTSYEKWEKDSLKNEDNPYEPYNVTEPVQIKAYPEGEVSITGRIIGGCLDCLSNLAGTKYDKVKEFAEKYKDDGLIWFLEACDLNVLDIRRVMWKLDSAGWFESAKGFIVGRPYCHGQEIMGLNQYEAVLGIVKKYNVPVIMDADIGHLPPMMPLVSGSMSHVTWDEKELKIAMMYR